VFLKLSEFGGEGIFVHTFHDFQPHTKQNSTGQNHTLVRGNFNPFMVLM